MKDRDRDERESGPVENGDEDRKGAFFVDTNGFAY